MTSVLIVVSAADRWTLKRWHQPSHRLLGRGAGRTAPDLRGGGLGHHHRHARRGGADGGPAQPQTGRWPAGKDRAVADYLRQHDSALAHPKALADVDPSDYDVVFYPGDHGPMEDLAVDADSGRILTAVLESGRPLALLCHAPRPP